ncbi:hypothetical protein LUZ60_000330 [Juncus effusus]|nr:hypothetical protein LUZ60_000330 [Juncus effusus]
MMAAVALMDEGTSWRRDPVVLVNMATQETVILHGTQAILQASIFLNQSNDMIGIRPASTESIQVMREVATTEEDECLICLERIEGTAKEMSCRHRFHGDCIEKWLRIHGSCPLCRFAMPLEEVKTEEERWRRGVWVTISLGRGRIDRRGDDGADSLRGDRE